MSKHGEMKTSDQFLILKSAPLPLGKVGAKRRERVRD
jgi:hypothetical protein